MFIRKVFAGLLLSVSLTVGVPASAQDLAAITARCSGADVAACQLAVQAAIAAATATLTGAALNQALADIAGSLASASSGATAEVKAVAAAAFNQMASLSTDAAQVQSFQTAANTLDAGGAVDSVAVGSLAAS